MEKAKRNIHYSFKVSPDEDAAIRQKMKALGIDGILLLPKGAKR